MHYLSHKLGRTTRNGSPFVCHLLPFIGYKNTAIMPIIGHNIPFVWNKGFNIVELIVTLTIAGILLAVAAPGLQSFVSSNRLTSQVNELLADISLARSEAIKRNVSAGLCASTSGTSCTASGNWANGWIVFYDNSGTNVVLKTHDALTGQNTLSATRTEVSTSTSSSVDTVTYSKSGAFSPTDYTYKFTVCDPRRKQTRIIDITVVGQTSITSGTC